MAEDNETKAAHLNGLLVWIYIIMQKLLTHTVIVGYNNIYLQWTLNSSKTINFVTYQFINMQHLISKVDMLNFSYFTFSCCLVNYIKLIGVLYCILLCCQLWHTNRITFILKGLQNLLGRNPITCTASSTFSLKQEIRVHNLIPSWV